jgi:ankyrin repeat protein/Arc/MetJ-type ribon-helix-helix transcriptional regulator
VETKVISVRVTPDVLAAIDTLVDAGLASSRSDAAAQLIGRGVAASEQLLAGAKRVAGELQSLKQELFGAVKARDKAKVEALINQERWLASVRTPDGESPVLTAVYHGAGEIAQLLRSRGAELNLYEAAALGDIARVGALLAENPEAIDSYSHDGWTPLHLAAFFGHDDLVANLLERGASVDPLGKNSMGNRPLHAALAARRSAAAKLLLEAGAAVNRKDAHGWTPLLLAAANGNTEMVADLLARGADRTVRNDRGESALDLALAHNHTEVVALLQ